MTDLSLAAIQAIAEPSLAPGVANLNNGSRTPGVAGSFANFVTQGLEQVNQQLQVSQVDLREMAAGSHANLHEVMIRLEKSRLFFQLALQVRNRLLESYQEVMRMQI